jgi:hypothetical protein
MSEEPDPLWLIPREVRDKLDRIAVKLHLREWQGLSLAERRRLCDQPCTSTSEAKALRALLRELLGHEPEPLSRNRAAVREDRR